MRKCIEAAGGYFKKVLKCVSYFTLFLKYSTISIIRKAQIFSTPGCQVLFSGSANTSWLQVGRSEGPETVTGCQTFFLHQRDLFSKDVLDRVNSKPAADRSNQSGVVLQAGLHQFRFEFQLPTDLPSSFEYKSDCGGRVLGRVQYCIRADVENARRTACHSRERQIVVIRPYNLNDSPHLADRVCLKKEITLACCCIRKGRIVCELALAKSGYVPGETMDISVQLFNGSSATVRSTHITFQQLVALSAGRNRHLSSALIFSISGQCVKTGGSAYYHDVIHIPPLPPSGTRQYCQIISVDYIVQIQIETTGTLGGSRVLELSLPVTIGTQPLQGAFAHCREVVPCYAHFDFNTGDILEHESAPAGAQPPLGQPVYLYYKTERRQLEISSGAAMASDREPSGNCIGARDGAAPRRDSVL
uniref:Arrestin_C domain-containing protein n=1 Tax=Macrostomum lignano TaxID=282301 RepID=A0A1I8JBD9_9PLAT